MLFAHQRNLKIISTAACIANAFAFKMLWKLQTKRVRMCKKFTTNLWKVVCNTLREMC